jgi:hypothetical protein
MSRLVVLDAGPLGLVTNPRATPAAIECREWLIKRIADGDQILVPEIADYEIRRELIRAKKKNGLARLNAFNAQTASRYLPITTATMQSRPISGHKLARAAHPLPIQRSLTPT